jgi:hypothetical protein
MLAFAVTLPCKFLEIGGVRPTKNHFKTQKPLTEVSGFHIILSDVITELMRSEASVH